MNHQRRRVLRLAILSALLLNAFLVFSRPSAAEAALSDCPGGGGGWSCTCVPGPDGQLWCLGMPNVPPMCSGDGVCPPPG